MNRKRTAILVEAALCIALSVVLGQLRLWEAPYGGSVSLEMLPLLVFALRRGVGPGVLAGALYGAISLMLGAYVVHWAQLILDYPLAYGLVGLAGLFAPTWRRLFDAGTGRAVARALVPGVLLGAAGRFAAAWLSGVVFFAEYAKLQPVTLYSLVYNALYLVPATAICLLALIAILPVLQRRIPSS